MKTLAPIKETGKDFDELEKRIKDVFKRFIYLPLIKTLIGDEKLLNAPDALKSALRSGRVVYYKGAFTGEFSASISKQLRELGASWDNQTGSYRISLSVLPEHLRRYVRDSKKKNDEKIAQVQKKLAQILPADIAEHIKSADVFSKALWKTDQAIAKTLAGITIVPKLSDEDRQKISEEWQHNMDLYITKFAEELVPKLREDVQAHVFAGGSHKELKKIIQKSYETTEAKAKFLARQETNLLLTKYKETRYVKAGVMEYKWGCVAGTPNHPVRPMHRALQGSIQKWDTPPITAKDGSRNNPGADYNCRCFAIPIVRFTK